MKIRIQQVTSWIPNTERIIIFTGTDQALLNSLIRVFREQTHTHELDVGMQAVEYVMQIDASLKTLEDVLKLKQDVKYILTFSEANYKKLLLQKQYTFAHTADDCDIKVIVCDRITNRETFIKNWCKYYDREYNATINKYIANLDVLRHVWMMYDVGLNLEECIEMLADSKSDNQHIMNKYSWFLQNLYLKKSSE